MIITNAVLQALFTSFKAEFQAGVTSAESCYTKVATVVQSTSKSNTYGWLGNFPQFREWIGSRVAQDMAAHGYQIFNKKFESTVEVPRDDIEDDEIGIYSPLFQEAGRAAAVYPDEHTFNLLKRGDAELCYDGQNFFDTDHPVYAKVDGTGTATTVSNMQGGTGTAWYLLDCSRAIKPMIFQRRLAPQFTAITKEEDGTVFNDDKYRYGLRVRSNVGFGFWQMAFMSKEALDAQSFNDAYKQLQSMKADGGRPLGIRPTLLVVPPALRAAALEVVKAERLANGATNVNREVVEVLDTPWLL